MSEESYEDKLKRYERLVMAHDMFYEYSDDPEKWRRGSEQLEVIRALEKDIQPEDRDRIWSVKTGGARG